MLKELTISNFKSFNEAVTFSMEADIKNVSEYKDHIIDVNDNKILKISTMYGPNGGGKSNLLEAIKLPSTMLDRRIFNKNYEFKCLYSDSDIVSETIFYVNDEFELGYSFEFKYDFTSLKDSYYINNREFKEVNLNIISETISFRENGSTEFKELLYRDETGIVETDYFTNYKFSQLGVGLSVLKKAYEDYANNDYNNELSARVIRSLYKEIKNINSLDFIVGAYNYLSNNEFKEKVINNLDYIDIKIADIIYKEETNDVYFVRNINVDGVTKQKLINLDQESKGTQKIFNIIYELLINSHRNILFIADDLNSHLHPKLSEVLIKIFTSSINNKSQLIFNSHDISAMNNVLFRRDEIWLVYRDDNYSSKLITISNIFNTKGERIRKDAKYGKQYLEGRYGAIPLVEKYKFEFIFNINYQPRKELYNFSIDEIKTKILGLTHNEEGINLISICLSDDEYMNNLTNLCFKILKAMFPNTSDDEVLKIINKIGDLKVLLNFSSLLKIELTLIRESDLMSFYINYVLNHLLSKNLISKEVCNLVLDCITLYYHILQVKDNHKLYLALCKSTTNYINATIEKILKNILIINGYENINVLKKDGTTYNTKNKYLKDTTKSHEILNYIDKYKC